MPKYHFQEIIDSTGLEDKVRFCSGADLWSSKAYKKFKIPSIKMTDGPSWDPQHRR